MNFRKSPEPKRIEPNRLLPDISNLPPPEPSGASCSSRSLVGFHIVAGEDAACLGDRSSTPTYPVNNYEQPAKNRKSLPPKGGSEKGDPTNKSLNSHVSLCEPYARAPHAPYTPPRFRPWAPKEMSQHSPSCTPTVISLPSLVCPSERWEDVAEPGDGGKASMPVELD